MKDHTMEKYERAVRRNNIIIQAMNIKSSKAHVV